MPICKRSIEPVDISRKKILGGVADELECVNNGTMSNIILQLSSLSKLAEDLFSELHLETCQLFYRTCKVTKQVELLKIQIIGLNPTAEEVSLQDINLQKPFRSSMEKDQEIITTQTQPAAIKGVYDFIDPPPSLYLLDPYREDGKQSLKFYTDPDYFFKLWKQEVAKDAKNQIKKQKGKVKRRPTKDLDPMYGENTRQNAAPYHDPHSINVRDIPLPTQNGMLVSGSVAFDRGAMMISDFAGNANIVIDEGLLPLRQMVPPGWHADSVPQRNSSYDQFPQPPEMQNFKFANAHEHNYRMNVSAGMNQNDSYNFNHSQVASDQDFDPNDTSLHHLSTSFPAPPNFNSPPNESMNNSSYFPPPPQNLVEASSEASDLDRDGFHFSEGVQDLLNLIEGVPLRNIDAVNGNPTENENENLNVSSIKSPTFPTDIPSPMKSPLRQSIAGMSPTSKSQFKDGSSLEREFSPDHLNTSQHRIRDNRSDLLEAIRKGIQLRKVEERRMITERRTTARFDVQSIMEAAFELRRKAMEGNDSGDEEDDVDGGWSDEG